MKNFLDDLWQDLREKRLWPVAVVLALALVAVPALLLKPAEEPAPAPAVAQAPGNDNLKNLARVVLDDEQAGNGSQLDLFDSNDPFKPPKSALKKEDDGVNSASGGGFSPGGSSVGESLAGSAGSGTSFGGSGGTSDGSGGGGSTGGGSTGGGKTKPKVKTALYTYVIDATFTQGDKTRKIKGMSRLEMLPNSSSPLLLFLGVDAKAANAVFLVDSTLKASGEGKCKPSDDECNFLYLGAGSEHMFTDPDGQTYTLRIDEIRRVKVKTKAASSKKSSSKSNKKATESHKKAGQSSQPTRRFVPPMLLDLVTVSNDPAGDSKSAAGSR